MGFFGIFEGRNEGLTFALVGSVFPTFVLLNSVFRRLYSSIVHAFARQLPRQNFTPSRKT